MNAERKFRLTVMIIVILIGGGFSTLTGMVYSEKSWWWIGMIAGINCSWFLAKLYLSHLNKAFKQGNNILLWGTLSGIFCGIICATIVHGLMGLIVYPDFPFSGGELPLSWTFVIVVGEIIGTGSGLITGAVLSGVYIAIKKGQSGETA